MNQVRSFADRFRTKQKLSMDLIYRGYKDWQIGDVVIGRVMGTQKDTHGKFGIVIEVMEVSFKGQKPEKFTGKNLYLNNNGVMAKVLKNADLWDEENDKPSDALKGEILQVEYRGTEKLSSKHKYAGKEVHVIHMELLNENSEDDAEQKVEL